MSYILDALRRAESERERGQVPGVHTPTAHADGPQGQARRPQRWWLGAAMLGLVLLGVGLSRGLLAPAPPAPLPAVTAQPPAVAAPAAVASAARMPTAELVRLPPPPPPPPEQAPVLRQPPAASPPPAPAPAQTAAAVPTLAALPEALRRQLPTLTTGGAMYSETPSKRMLIINGQLFQEGASVAPGLVLEQIKLNSAVLSFQGQRFSISY